MCGFAADQEAARPLLVGRVLTVERVRQLNAKDQVLHMDSIDGIEFSYGPCWRSALRSTRSAGCSMTIRRS
jgi:hypothetical protein